MASDYAPDVAEMYGRRESLFEGTCPEEDCAFAIWSFEREECIQFLQRHLRNAHARTLGEDEVTGCLLRI